LPAEVVGVHRPTDLAMLRVKTNKLTPIRLTDRDPPAIGSWLATPGTGDVPVAIGIVSAQPRKSEAPVGVLGVLLGETSAGPRVDEVLPGSAAQRASIRQGDVISSVNGQATADRRSLISAIRDHHPGEVVLLRVVRNEDEKLIRARLRERPGNPPPGSLDHQKRMGGELSNRRTGFPLVLQHDSVLDPSECGGPIVDLEGQVVGINIARSGRVASLTLPAKLVAPLLDDLKSGRLAPATWSVGSWHSPWERLEAKITSLEMSLREAQRVRDEAQHRLRRSETVVRRALVERAAAELRKVDARQDSSRRRQAESERQAADRAVHKAAAPFEEARREVESAARTIHEILTALAAARQQQAGLQDTEPD
jgi:S1-C subfamily serine protease